VSSTAAAPEPDPAGQLLPSSSVQNGSRFPGFRAFGLDVVSHQKNSYLSCYMLALNTPPSQVTACHDVQTQSLRERCTKLGLHNAYAHAEMHCGNNTAQRAVRPEQHQEKAPTEEGPPHRKLSCSACVTACKCTTRAPGVLPHLRSCATQCMSCAVTAAGAAACCCHHPRLNTYYNPFTTD
jgi:hypothetical protein